MLTAKQIVRVMLMEEALANPGTWKCRYCEVRYLHGSECPCDREEREREVRFGELLP